MPAVDLAVCAAKNNVTDALAGQKFVRETQVHRVGLFQALRLHGVHPDWEPVWRGSAQEEIFVRAMLNRAQPDGIVCANDLTAARLMQVLIALGVRIPEEVRIVGMDDVRYASLLPVPLTTVRQDCTGIGAVAMATMHDRLEHPKLPIRDVLVPVKLVVRKSCGGHPTHKAEKEEAAAAGD